MPPIHTPEGDPVLRMEDVEVTYNTEDGDVFAVRGVSYDLFPDETLALVGESGCGKSQSSYAAMGLVQPPGVVSGRILFDRGDGNGSVDILKLKPNSSAMRQIRGGPMAMVFQEPMTALSPVHRIGHHLDEVLKLHTDLDASQRYERACELIGHVGIPDAERRYRQYSFEFSGGMRQRIMIAVALACNPRVLFADEPTTGLDVTIQAQILSLMRSLRDQHRMGVVLITHDLAVVAENADRVAVMYLGRIVETADVETVFRHPRHPYTIALLKSVVGSPLASDGRLQAIKGTVPGPYDRVAGCPFHPRCPLAKPGLCDGDRVPELSDISDGHQAACFRLDQTADQET